MGTYAKLNPAFQALLDAASQALIEAEAAQGQIATTGTTQVAAVNAAGASALSAVAGAVTTAQTAASQAQGFRNDAQNYAAQANFAGYTGTFATRAAFGSPSGKPAGVYLVLADESHSGQPWAYFVVSNAITASWGVVLQNATQGVDLLGPLVNRGTADNRQILLIPKYAPQGVDFAITKNVTAQPVGGRSNEVVNLGHNINPGGGKIEAGKAALRIGMESNYYPEVGKKWTEFHLEAQSESGAGGALRFLSMEMDVDRTNGLDGKILRQRFAQDLLNITDAEAQKVLVFITPTAFSLQNRQAYDTTAYNGPVLGARQSDGQTFSVAGVYDSTWVPAVGGAALNLTALELGDFKGFAQLPRRTRIGDGTTSGTMLQILGGGAGILEQIRLRTNDGQVGDGVAINAYNGGDGLMGRLLFQIGPGGAGQARLQAGNTLALIAMQTGDIEIPTAAAGLIQTTPGGARRRLVYNNDGTVSHVAA